MKMPTLHRKRPFLSLVMVVATITVVGIVAFRFLDAQDNTQVAKTPAPVPTQTQVAKVESVEDVETVTNELDQADAELNAIDAELDTEFAF